MKTNNPKDFLVDLFLRAVEVASATHCLPSHIEKLRHKRIHVVGAGKAAAEMARVVEEYCLAELSGIVITRYGHGANCNTIEVVEAAHPLPDDQGVFAAERILASLANLDSEILVVCLMSGGASALMTLPHQKISLEEKQFITRKLLLSGADIEEMNIVRKHLSAVKGGRLMRQIFPATALTLSISDVVGDDPSTIGSGPTVPDPTTCSDVLEVLQKYSITVSEAISSMLVTGELETPKPEDPIFKNSSNEIVARPLTSITASADMARKAGIETVIIGDSVVGDTNQAAKQHAEIIRDLLASNQNRNSFLLLSGGETTVTVTGKGKGGPNTQFALALAIELENLASVHAIACDTDGIDGSESNAGALINPTTLARARLKGMNPSRYLADNDSFSFFERLDDLIETGPTLTNINDFRAILVEPA